MPLMISVTLSDSLSDKVIYPYASVVITSQHSVALLLLLLKREPTIML